MTDTISRIVTLIIAFLAIFIGLSLAYLTKLELKDGLKYIVIIKNLLFSGLISAFLYFFNPYLAFIGIAIFIILTYTDIPNPILYALVAYIFFFSAHVSQDSLSLVSTLTYILGLSLGLVAVAKHPKMNMKKLLARVFLSYIWFLIIGAILILI